MLASIFAFTYALIIFGLVGEADSTLFRVLGFAAGTWMAIAGAVAGYQAANR